MAEKGFRMDKSFEDSSESAEPTDSELSLAEKHHFVESLLDVTHGILYIYDLARRRNVFANEGIHRVLGYSTTEVREMGDSIIPSLMHPDDFRHYIERIAPRYAQVADGERVVNSYRMKNRSGDWKWIESTEVVYRRDPDGSPRQIIGLGVDITKRKMAETALEDTKEILSQFVLHSPIYTFIKDVTSTESRVLIASENYRDMIGISGREMTGKTMAELFPPEFAEKITADDWMVASKGESLRLDEELNGRSYTTIKFPIRKGDKVFLAGYTIDITERKATENALRESEYFFKESQRASHTGSYRLDFKTWIWEYSEVLGQIFGIDATFKNDIPGWLDLVHPDDRETMERHFREDVVERHQRFNREYRIVRASGGEIRWVHGLGELVLDAKGDPIHMIGTIRDITERKAAEDAIRESAERLRFAMETSHIGAWDLDLADHTAFRSLEHDRIFGYDEPLPKWTYEMFLGHVLPEDRGKVDADFRQAMETLGDWNFQCRILRRDGAVRWIWAAGRHTLERPENPPRMAGIVQDITERKQAEQELERHRNHLEELVEERTTQLKSANLELDSFCHSVSHDLRAPLRYLDGFAGLLMSNCRQDLPEEGQRYVDIIASSARKMGVLIDDLLKFSRTSRQEMSLQRVNMDLALREALAPVQSASQARIIEWKIGELSPVGGDHNLLRQVWANLLENAVKYTGKKDAARIEIGCEERGKEIVFSIRDNGAGFDPRYADKLFGVFQRLHRPEEFEGTGIGLATVHRIVSRHGGRVWAESSVGQGATFHFALPKPREQDHA